jgi:hypothetical protein
MTVLTSVALNFDRQEFWDWQDEPLEKEGKNEASAKSKLITMT